MINGTFIRKHNATVISFYEFMSGVAFISIFLMIKGLSFSSGTTLYPPGAFLIVTTICGLFLFFLKIINLPSTNEPLIKKNNQYAKKEFKIFPQISDQTIFDLLINSGNFFEMKAC